VRIRLLSAAVEDLYEGRLFYEKQGEGVGEYFFDSLFSDIDSLTLYGGIHPKVFGYHRMLSKRFPYAIYLQNRRGIRSCGLASPRSASQSEEDPPVTER